MENGKGKMENGVFVRPACVAGRMHSGRRV